MVVLAVRTEVNVFGNSTGSPLSLCMQMLWCTTLVRNIVDITNGHNIVVSGSINRYSERLKMSKIVTGEGTAKVDARAHHSACH